MTSEHYASLLHIARQWAEVAAISSPIVRDHIRPAVMVPEPAGPFYLLATRHPERVLFSSHNYMFALGTVTVAGPAES